MEDARLADVPVLFVRLPLKDWRNLLNLDRLMSRENLFSGVVSSQGSHGRVRGRLHTIALY